MALSLISQLGGVIQGDWSDEYIITAIAGADSPYAGWAVAVLATGLTAGSDDGGTSEEMIGLLLPHYTIDMDAIITANLVVDIVVPKAGHLYAVHCDDLGSSEPGMCMENSSNIGEFKFQAVIENDHVCRTYRYTSGDTVALVIWGS